MIPYPHPRATTWAMFFVVAVIWPSAGFSQDSLQSYSLPRWKVDRLIRIALKAKECDSLVNEQQQYIKASERTEAKADSVIKAQGELIALKDQEIAKRDTLEQNQNTVIGKEKKKVVKWKVVSGILAALAILAVI